MIIIRHAWLNLRRNRILHLKMGSFILLILLFIFLLLLIYQTASAYFLNYQDQAAAIVKGVKDLNQTEQANQLNMTDYVTLREMSYVKKSQLTRQGLIKTSLRQPKEQVSGEISSFSSDQAQESYLPVTMLDNESLKKLLSTKKVKLRGRLPLEKNSCVISQSLAETNKLKVGDTIQIGTSEHAQSIEIVGIADFSTLEWLAATSNLLISLEVSQQEIVPTFSSVTFQLTSKKEIKNFVKDFKKAESFKEYSLISQGWSQGMLKSFKDTLALLLNGVITALILGVLLIIVGYQLAIRQRQDFYTLHLMGMNPKLLAVSSSLENVLIVLGASIIALLSSTKLSSWITGEWLIKLQKNLTEQDPFVDWKMPHLDQSSLALNGWLGNAGLLFLVLCLLIVLLLTNLRIAKIVRTPLKEVAKL